MTTELFLQHANHRLQVQDQFIKAFIIRWISSTVFFVFTVYCVNKSAVSTWVCPPGRSIFVCWHSWNALRSRSSCYSDDSSAPSTLLYLDKSQHGDVLWSLRNLSHVFDTFALKMFAVSDRFVCFWPTYTKAPQIDNLLLIDNTIIVIIGQDDECIPHFQETPRA